MTGMKVCVLVIFRPFVSWHTPPHKYPNINFVPSVTIYWTIVSFILLCDMSQLVQQ